jgi:hypothetical protein
MFNKSSSFWRVESSTIDSSLLSLSEFAIVVLIVPLRAERNFSLEVGIGLFIKLKTYALSESTK